jgi:hypothetical protein
LRLTGQPISQLIADPASCVDEDAGHARVLVGGNRRWSGTGRHATPGLMHLAYHPTA